jgi:hypothetical protein
VIGPHRPLRIGGCRSRIMITVAPSDLRPVRSTYRRSLRSRIRERLLGNRSRPVMRSSVFASGGLGPDLGGGARFDRPRALAFGHRKTPLYGVGASARRTTQTPRRPMALAGSEERAGYEGSASVSTIHAAFATEVECKMALIPSNNFEAHDPSLIRLDAQDAVRLSRLRIVYRNLGRAADAHHAAGTRRVSATQIAPTSGRVVTQIQSDSSRADSPVRVRYAQPGSWSSTAQCRAFST